MKSVEERCHYKERQPEDTVNFIQNILVNYGIDVEEKWLDEDEHIGTQTVRVDIKGTTVGTNGKGVSKRFSRASGYAEFIERLQNDILINDVILKDNSINYHVDPDEVVKSSKEIIEENNSFVKQYFKVRNMEKASAREKRKAFEEVQKLDLIKFDAENKYLTTPFYSMREQKIMYLPSFAYKSSYGSNGMAAGNTREEALIQGLSEILERYIQLKVFSEKIVFPDVPESYLDRYPYIKNMYQELKDIKGYEFRLKDCSMGGKYPVAALLGIEKNTGKFGIKFGCHPDFGIAMERTFTEATQGRKIDEYTNCSTFDFFNEGVMEPENIVNTCKVGAGAYPFQLLSNNFTFDFTPVKDVSEMTSEEILKDMLNSILAEGYDVLIRDNSCLGFPAYHIVIPGMSEIRELTDNLFRVYNTQSYVAKRLENIDDISEEDCKYIASVIKYYANSFLENDMRKFFVNVSSEYHFRGEEAFSGALYLAAMCHAYCEQYDKAAYYMKCLLKTGECNGADMDSVEIKRDFAIKYYFEARCIGLEHDESIEYLKVLFDKDIYNEIDILFNNKRNIFRLQYSDLPKESGQVFDIKKDIKRKIAYIRQNNIIDQTSLSSIAL